MTYSFGVKRVFGNRPVSVIVDCLLDALRHKVGMNDWALRPYEFLHCKVKVLPKLSIARVSTDRLRPKASHMDVPSQVLTHSTSMHQFPRRYGSGFKGRLE